MSTPSADRLLSTPALVVGESVMDRIEDPGKREVIERPGGSPANVALGLARLGDPVRLHTALGRDAYGVAIADHLTASGVEIDERSWVLDRTSSALARKRTGGVVDYEFDVTWTLRAPELRDAALLHVGSASAFASADSDALLALVAGAADDEVVISFDPNVRPALLPPRRDALARMEVICARADVVKLSDEDLAWLYPGVHPDDLVDDLLELGVKIVAVTLGPDGALLASPATRVQIEAPMVSVRDTVGAGDTFMAALLHEVRRDPSVLDVADPDRLEQVGRIAVAAAAVTVQRVGADLPRLHDVERAVRSHAVRRRMLSSFLACSA